MPELPEVESFRLVLSSLSNMKVKKVFTRERGGGPRDGLFDEIVIRGNKNEDKKRNRSKDIGNTTNSEGNSYDDIEREFSDLEGLQVTGSGRKGKFVWMSLQNGFFVVFHCGMTGALVRNDSIDKIRSGEICIYKSFKVDVTNGFWPPKFSKLEIEFDNGVSLCFCDPRRLGRVLIKNENPLNCLPISRLALDPLNDEINLNEVTDSIKGHKCKIKDLLLSQDKVFCGIGNWLADEILFQSEIHPASLCYSLSSDQISNIVGNIKKIIAVAVSVNANSDLFPKHWIFHYRWNKRKINKKVKNKGENKDDENNDDKSENHEDLDSQGDKKYSKENKNNENLDFAIMPDGKKIIFETISGRTSAHVISSSPSLLPQLSPNLNEDIESLNKEKKRKKVDKTSLEEKEVSFKKVARGNRKKEMMLLNEINLFVKEKNA